jgi:CheY-like chemotaxis protein
VATDILIIEDEPLIAMDIEQMVEGLGHNVVSASPAPTRKPWRSTTRRTPKMILADIQLADGSSGIDAVNDILSTHPVPVIFITAFPERLLTGERPEPTFLVTKPFNPDMVKALISQALFFDEGSRAAVVQLRERVTVRLERDDVHPRVQHDLGDVSDIRAAIERQRPGGRTLDIAPEIIDRRPALILLPAPIEVPAHEHFDFGLVSAHRQFPRAYKQRQGGCVNHGKVMAPSWWNRDPAILVFSSITALWRQPCCTTRSSFS